MNRALHLCQEDLRARFKQLTEIELPVRAAHERWPLRLDHCFKRVCLDWACGDCWYAYIQRPAERHLEGETLKRAVQCAEDLLSGGVDLLRARNEASLRWRGKQKKKSSRASEEKRHADR